MLPWGKFPFEKEWTPFGNAAKPNGVQSYIEDLMKSMAQAHAPKTETAPTAEEPAGVQADVFETFDHVYIRIRLPDEASSRGLKIFHTSNKAVIENLYEPGDRHTLILPCLVKKRGAAAIAKDGILEIKIPVLGDAQLTEIDVSERL